MDLYNAGGTSYPQLEREYGVNRSTISGWVKQLSPIRVLEEETVRKDIARVKKGRLRISFCPLGYEICTVGGRLPAKVVPVFLESKVGVVIGTHPRVIQPFEVFKGQDGYEMVIYYSIGNFAPSGKSLVSKVVWQDLRYFLSWKDTGLQGIICSPLPLPGRGTENILQGGEKRGKINII